MPYYNISEFIDVCGRSKEDIILIGSVLGDARNHFNIDSKIKLLDFINNNGLEELSFVNTKDWDKNPDKNTPIKVDSYKFQSMNKLGYIAFMYSKTTKKWLIKSFHLSDDRNNTMELALRKSGLLR